jgi:hypothetical protein
VKTTLPLALSAAALAALALAAAPAQDERLPGWEALRARFDLDFDGKVSASEYPRGRSAFRRLDRDRDGFLTEGDFRRDAPAPAETPVAAEAVDTSPEALEFFETRIRPLLAARCYECHSGAAPKLKGGLRVDGREWLVAGGSSGPAIVPGDPDASLLVQAVRYSDDDLRMPPKQALDDAAVKDLEHWVGLGAPWPGSPAKDPAAPDGAREHVPYGQRDIDFDAARAQWPFTAPVRHDPPEVRDQDWAWSPIDRFLLAAMEKQGIAPVGDADRRTWLRRVTFDLTGLPPTPEEIATFEKDRSPTAFETVVDRLLASPAFGERWGRHWLDVARYAESSGKDSNVLYPHAWRYRDWVIAAFNRDLAYDRFLTEQIAGDLLPASDDDGRAQQVIATGYLALGAKGHTTRDARQFALDVADEQVDAISQGMLGLTVACARCHDHKFDPIPTSDYYAMAGILLSTETLYGTQRGLGNLRPADLVDLPAGANVPNGPAMDAATRRRLERARDAATPLAESAPVQPRTGAPADAARPDPQAALRARLAREQSAILDGLLARFGPDGRALPSNRLAMGVDEGRARDVAVLERGELDKPGRVVRRGVPQVMTDGTQPAIGAGSGRSELAAWIASPSNPLTARVWSNRVWLHLFGAGIVPTPDNFGASGQPPDHPELLDWLATELVRNGWSTKDLVRRIVLSHAYRLASQDDPRCERVDPEVVTLWRFPERRLEAEEIRDAMLAAAGTLPTAPPVGSPVGTLEGVVRREELIAPALAERPVRSVYLPILRGRIPDLLEVFDAADPDFVTGDRDETTVATQALTLMNDADVLALSDALAARLLAHPGDDDDRVVMAFELTLGRKPSATEKDAVRRFLREFPKAASQGEPGAGTGRRDSRDDRRGRRGTEDARPGARDPRALAWSAFAQSLFLSAEFRELG